jgi:lipopolysaccharide export system permease protein
MEGVTPRMLWLSGREAKTSSLLSYSELLDLIALSPRRHDLVINLHYHLTWPLANLLLLLLALPFAVQFERGSRVGRIVLAILICGSYLVVDLTCQNLGRREYLHPILAAWTPTILFGSLGTVMFGGIRT